MEKDIGISVIAVEVGCLFLMLTLRISRRLHPALNSRLYAVRDELLIMENTIQYTMVLSHHRAVLQRR